MLAGGTRRFSNTTFLVSQSQGELRAALCLMPSQQGHKWDVPCKPACLRDGDENGNGEMESFCALRVNPSTATLCSAKWPH